MAFTQSEIENIEKSGDNFLKKIRPPEDMRKEIDFLYLIEGNSVVIYQTWPNPLMKTITRIQVAKATFVRTQNIWKIYWQRADLKWHGYTPYPTSETIDEFFEVVDKDKHACFFG